MYNTMKGTNTHSVMTSWRIFNCGKLNSELPIRFAGTWIKYSKNAMHQLTIAAINQGLSLRSFKGPYQAKVMNTFDAISINTVKRTKQQHDRDEVDDQLR